MTFAYVQLPDWKELEELLSAATASRVPAIQDSLVHALEGGKRLRAALVAASAGFAAPDMRAVARTAAAMELIHLASLIHDDIIDEAAFRRARPSLYRLLGRVPAMLTGDYLFASAFNLIIDLPKSVLKIVTRTIRAMCEGEIAELGAKDFSLPAYFARVRKKTASLIVASCRSGGILAGLRGEQLRSLEKYALNLGTAFQIVDDLMDLAGSPELLGKPCLQDLTKGIPTLPVIHYLNTHAEGPAWKEKLARGGLSGEEARELAGRLISAGCLHYALGVILWKIRLAVEFLEFLPAGRAREDLKKIAWRILTPLANLNHPGPAQEVAETIEFLTLDAGGPEEIAGCRQEVLGAYLRVGKVQGRQAPDDQPVKGGVGKLVDPLEGLGEKELQALPRLLRTGVIKGEV